MPIYEYRCENGHTFEVFQSMSDDPVRTCETCDAPVQRVYHPVAVHYKGSGFYSTDYAGKSKAADSSDGDSGGGDSGGGDSKEKSDSKSGSTSDSKSDSKAASSNGGSKAAPAKSSDD